MCDKCREIEEYHYADNEEIAFFTSKTFPYGRFCIKMQIDCCECDELSDWDMVISHCPWCGRDLTQFKEIKQNE